METEGEAGKGTGRRRGSRRQRVRPAVDIYSTATEVVVLADMPGVRREDLDVRIAGDELLIDASVAGREEAESRLPWGYERRFRLSSTIDREQIRAKLEAGVLRVELGKVGAGEARHVEVD